MKEDRRKHRLPRGEHNVVAFQESAVSARVSEVQRGNEIMGLGEKGKGRAYGADRLFVLHPGNVTLYIK